MEPAGASRMTDTSQGSICKDMKTLNSLKRNVQACAREFTHHAAGKGARSVSPYGAQWFYLPAAPLKSLKPQATRVPQARNPCVHPCVAKAPDVAAPL